MIILSTFRCASGGNLKPIFPWIVGVALFCEIAGSAPRIALAAQPAITKACNAPTLPITGSVVQVSTEAQLQTAVSNLQPGTTILVANGTYNLSRTLLVNNVNNVTIRGASGCDGVVLVGQGMTNPNFGAVPDAIWTNSSNTVIAHLTVRDVYRHPIILNPGAQRPRIYSVRLKNGGEQLIKGNPTSLAQEGINDGIVEYSIMEFDTTSRDFYTNGVDVLTGRNWIIRDNLFRNLRAPAGQLAGPAILMWGGSSNTIVERNLFLNTQRGIALGLEERAPNDHSGGIIRNNIFFRKPGETGDTGIYVADSPNTKVLHNTVILSGTYPFAIEYRFPDTTGVDIRFNLTDDRIVSRDGATGNVANNITSATSDLFADTANNDLHLRGTAGLAIDAASAHPDVTDDYDGQLRPTSGASPRDLGADEFYELARAEAEYGEVLTAAPGQASVLAGGFESGGASRGPAFQLFNSAGTLQTTQFVLNPDFRIDVSFVVGNYDADTAGEILVGGQETSGLGRGPAYQLFDTDGTLKLTRFVLNPDFTNLSFSPFNVGSSGVLACGREVSGLGRGPVYQAFDASGSLVRTQFVLNPDFTADNSCIATNLDGGAGDEVIVGGREVSGLAPRGPAFQIFGSDGSFRLTRFVLNPDFTETKFTVVDVGGSKNIVVSGRETSGAVRGPAYQAFDASGNFILTRFVLNPDFTGFQTFGANITNSVVGEEIVTGGTETSGLARGPAIQVWDKNGNHLFTRFVLNPDFTEVTFSKIDINNDGLDEILVVGRETKGLQRGPAFQLFDGNGNLLVTQFVLNADFTNLKPFTVDQNADGDKEVGIGGTETSGLMRGPAYQIFESNGALLQTRFVLNPDF